MSGLLTSLLMARWLGAIEFGTYSFVMSLTSMGGVIATLGFTTLVIRQTAQWSTLKRWHQLKGLLCLSAALTFLSSSAIAMAIIVGGIRIQHFETVHDYIPTLILGVMLMTTNVQASLLTSVLQGLNRVTRSVIPGNLGVPLLLLSGVALWHYWHNDLSMYTVVMLQLGLSVGWIVAQAMQLFRALPREFIRATPVIRSRKWIPQALPFLFTGTLTIVNLRADVFLLGVLKGPEAAGIYNAASRGALLLVMGLGTIVGASQPVLARLHAMGDVTNLQKLLTTMSRISLLFSVTAALPLIFLGHAILRILFGPVYSTGSEALAILSTARIVNAGTGALGPFLSMSNRARTLAIGLALEALLNVGFNLVLIHLWGIDGSALATGGSMAIMNIVMSVIVLRTTGYDVSFLGIRRHP